MLTISQRVAFLTRHPLTADRPLAALRRFVAWQVRSRVYRETEFHWIGGSKLIVRRGMTGATGNIYCGLHEFADMAFLLHFLRPQDLFGDIGANVGSYTVLASSVCHAQVLAVEPDPDTAISLRKNIKMNQVDATVTVAETAVGDKEGSIQFTIGLDTMNKVSMGGGNGPSRLVPMATLDRLFTNRQPTMLKLDVEGFEAAVLRGAHQLLKSDSLMALQSESQEPEVRKLLHKNGFVEQHYNPFTRELSGHQSLPQSNGLFVRNLPEVKARLHSARSFTVLHHQI
jgi:FkbM family methyltransferase